jgi:photosystem II stability/assembly factor-like uncharacterized protein
MIVYAIRILARQMMTRLGAFTHALGLAALSIAILFGAGAVRAAETNQQDERLIALAYDPGTQTLLKADANALYRSSDGGQSWHRTAMPYPEDGKISAVAASSAARGVIYVAGPGLGVVRSDDGGKTWVERTEGLPGRDVIAVAAHTTQPDTVYAVVKEQGIYRSQDAGKSWRMMDRGPRDGLVQLIHSDMAGSMQTGWLFAATPSGIRRIMDCFCLWQDAGGLASEARSVTYDPKQPEHIYAATEKGLFRSSDGGENWTEMTSPISNAVALVFGHSGTLYVINADGRLFRSADQGVTWAAVDA